MAEDRYTIEKASNTMHIRRALWKQNERRQGMWCLVSAYMIRFEQAEHTGLTDKEERKTMKKRRMKTKKIKHYRVDHTLHIDEKVYVLVFIYVSSINI